MQVFPSTYAVEVYVNEQGEVVIRQDDPSSDYAYIAVPVKHVDALIRALRQVKREAKEG